MRLRLDCSCFQDAANGAGHRFAIALRAGLVALWVGGGGCHPVWADTPSTLRCEVTYAGQAHRFTWPATTDPYRVASVPIGERFRFKGVHVVAPDRVPRIDLYVYVETAAQPVLVQQVHLDPPFPLPRVGAPVDLVGTQHLYAGALERELIYRCWLEATQ